MQQEVENAKNTFRQLSEVDTSHESIIALLLSLRAQVHLSEDDTGWALWNLCDQYAMLRDAKSQYVYQSEFHEWSKTNLPPLRLHWVVSDSTQALTLIQGGKIDFWWHCYQFANERAPIIKENRTVRFESHRANANAYIYFREFDRAEAAISSIADVLSEDPAWVNCDFAMVTLKTLLIEFYNAQGQGVKARDAGEEVVRFLDGWLEQIQASERVIQEPLLGTWDQLNADRPPTSVFVATHNAACALAIAKQFTIAEHLFRILLDGHSAFTPYAEALYLLACWENRHDRNEVRALLQNSQSQTSKFIHQYAPVLVPIAGEALNAFKE